MTKNHNGSGFEAHAQTGLSLFRSRQRELEKFDSEVLERGKGEVSGRVTGCCFCTPCGLCLETSYA